MPTYFEDLKPGMAATSTHEVTEQDLFDFARVSGDRNPIHLDEAYAATTPFKGRIAHGILVASYISALIASELPGPGAIYVGQTLNFRRPVKIGDTVTTKVEIVSVDAGRARAVLACTCSVGGKSVLTGEATIMVPRRFDERG
jgi:3-hydroxybutyryl-CoA dehydratase